MVVGEPKEGVVKGREPRRGAGFATLSSFTSLELMVSGRWCRRDMKYPQPNYPTHL